MKLLSFATVILLLVGCGAAPQPTPLRIMLASTPRQLIIDTDLAADDGNYFWDSLAAVFLTDESLGTIQEMNLVVQSEDGQTIHDTNGKRVRVAAKADAARFEQILLQSLNGQFNPEK